MVASDSFDHPFPARCAAVATVSTAALAALLRWLLPVLSAPAHDLDETLVRGCAAAALLAAAWLWTGTLRLVLAAHGGRGEHALHVRSGLPAPARRAVLVACGVALAGSVASGAGAAPGHGDRLPVPDRAPSHAVAAYVVRPGDSLWSIADRTLPAGAGAWPRLYAVNRDVIGPDPDLIRPAQRLALPRR